MKSFCKVSRQGNYENSPIRLRPSACGWFECFWVLSREMSCNCSLKGLPGAVYFCFWPPKLARSFSDKPAPKTCEETVGMHWDKIQKKGLSDHQFDFLPLQIYFPVCLNGSCFDRLFKWSFTLMTCLSCSTIDMRFKMKDNFLNFYESVQLLQLNKKKRVIRWGPCRVFFPNHCVILGTEADTIDILIKTSSVWFGPEMNGLMFILGMLLIGAYILRTQFSIRRANVAVICFYPSPAMCLLYWSNPAVAECFLWSNIIDSASR